MGDDDVFGAQAGGLGQRGVLRSGALEDSATNSIMEMASMIEGHRTYDTNMKFLTMQDETLGQTVRRIAATA